MAGILNLLQAKPRAHRSAVVCLALPRAADWETWSFSADGTAPEAQPATAAGALPEGVLVALPARHVVTVPLWLQTTDPALFRELVGVQLERRNITGLAETHWGHAEILREETRTLVSAFVMNAVLPPELLPPQAKEYDIEARCRPLAEDACSVWPEEGGLAVGCTRGKELAYLHFFPGRTTLEEIAIELNCLRQWLSWEGVILDQTPVFFLGDQAPLPPRLPKPPLALLPAEVHSLRKQFHKSRTRRRLYWNLLGAYLLAILAAAIALGNLKWKAHRLEHRIDDVAPDVARLGTTAARWRALQPALNPSYYPIECLLACVQILPPEVRLTEFDYNPKKVIFMGEGRDAASIFKFFDAVKADPFLKKWQWTLPQPQLLPNNRAQFQLEGIRENAPAK